MVTAASFIIDRADRKAPRIYHNHSRSRQLLSLPISPHVSHDLSFDLPYSFSRRSPHKSFPMTRFRCPSYRFFSSAILTSSFVLCFFVIGLTTFSQTTTSSIRAITIGSRALFAPPLAPLPNPPTSVWNGFNHSHALPRPLPSQNKQPLSTAAHSVVSTNNSSNQPKSISPPSSKDIKQGHTIPPVDKSSPDQTSTKLSDAVIPATTVKTPSLLNEPSAAVLSSAPSSKLHDKRDPADFKTFTRNTALNYFHLHKTGGVSFKERLFDFFHDPDKFNMDGEHPIVVDTCHNTGPSRNELGTESTWSCDWGEIERLPENQRKRIDLVVGHQYWHHGANYWVPSRDMRYFTVMRHPLHRKISFYYHFFARNVGRTEESVSTKELIDFVLARKVPDSPLVRDAGPAYYASRLWSDGETGFNDFRYEIPVEKENDFVEKSIRRLRRNFVFIGLQSQERASLCMLRETVGSFAVAHGIRNISGLDAMAKPRERMNTGSYGLSAEKLWVRMSAEQKAEFKKVEKVDLAIYRESVSMFREMVSRFSCEELVEQRSGDDIAL